MASRIFEVTYKAHSFCLHCLSFWSMHMLDRRGHCELDGEEGKRRREAMDWVCGMKVWSWIRVKGRRRKLYEPTVVDTSRVGNPGVDVPSGRGLTEWMCLWLGEEIWIRDLDLRDVVLHSKFQRVSEVVRRVRYLEVDLEGLVYELLPRSFASGTLWLLLRLWCLHSGDACLRKVKKMDCLLGNILPSF